MKNIVMILLALIAGVLVLIGFSGNGEKRPEAPPVAAALEVADRAPGVFDQPAVHVGPAHAGLCADRRMLRAHRDHHVGTGMHVP